MIAALALTLFTHASARDETIQLAVGQQRVVNIISGSGSPKVSIANPNVADVKALSATQLLVTALAPGQTDLTMVRGNNQQRYVVQVTASDSKAIYKEVKRMLGDRDGIQVVQSGERILLEGFALTIDDMQRVEQVTAMYPTVVKNQVRLDPSAKNMVAQQVNSALQRAGLRGAIATVVGSTVFLEGKVDTEGDMKKAELVIKAVGENIQNLLSIGSTKMVHIDVDFMEVSTQSLDLIGIRYPTDVSGTVTGTASAGRVFLPVGTPDSLGFGGTASVTSSFGFGFKFTDGISRSLAKPRLVCASGQKCNFLAGGEIPIPLQNTLGAVNVQFKEYGVKLGMTPVADAKAIHLELEAEVSNVDRSVAVLGIPGFVTRKVKTSIAVRSGQTIALSGLLQNDTEKLTDKIPLLGHIPILGELFKSRQFRDRKTELIVFVTPRLVDADDEALKQAIVDMTERLDRGSRDVRWGVFD